MSYKLYYFDAQGRGEIIRLIFAATDTKYEDIRFSMEEWGSKYKAIAPTGVAPWLEDPVSGKTLVQSFAIARLLATRHGLMGSDHIEYYKIEKFLFQLKDIQEAAIPAKFSPEEHRPAAKAAFIETKGPSLLANLVKFLKASDSKFAVGKSLSLADLAILTMTDFVKSIGDDGKELLEKYEELAAHRSHLLESNEKLAEYIAARKPAPF